MRTPQRNATWKGEVGQNENEGCLPLTYLLYVESLMIIINLQSPFWVFTRGESAPPQWPCSCVNSNKSMLMLLLWCTWLCNLTWKDNVNIMSLDKAGQSYATSSTVGLLAAVIFIFWKYFFFLSTFAANVRVSGQIGLECNTTNIAHYILIHFSLPVLWSRHPSLNEAPVQLDLMSAENRWSFNLGSIYIHLTKILKKCHSGHG